MIEIVGFSTALAPHFERLNVEWLERYFAVEPIDAQVLANPRREIVEHGGDILFALDGEDVVGTCALKHHGDGVFELTKMAVAPRGQGRGTGRLLVDAVIARWHALDGKRLYLESHHKLGPALKLYETSGFRHAPRPDGPSVYARSDVYMVYGEAPGTG